MSSFYRRLLVPVVGLLVVGSTGLAVNAAGASDDPTPAPVIVPAQVETPQPAAETTTTATPSTTAAPATQVAPKPKAAEVKKVEATKPAVEKPIATKSASAEGPKAPQVDDKTEIGTACVITKSSDGSIVKEGC